MTSPSFSKKKVGFEPEFFFRTEIENSGGVQKKTISPRKLVLQVWKSFDGIIVSGEIHTQVWSLA